MFDRRRLGIAVAAGLLGAAGVAGCSTGSSSSSGNTTGITTHNGATSFSAAQLRKALLTRINGVGPAMKADAGAYATLPEIKAARAQMAGVTVQPKGCLQATVLEGADLDTGALNGSPAAVVNFKVGTNGVSEVLAAPKDSATAAALGKAIAPGCASYTATAGGNTYKYSFKQSWAKGIGLKQARVLNITTEVSGQSDIVWSVLFQGNGFVGALTVAGPNASRAAVQELGTQGYEYAAKALS
ncbi:MAG TPA: hypothetical protein VH478_18575 [Trebonia sp.]|nr:hypothetical protein [Trebonia sp.]